MAQRRAEQRSIVAKVRVYELAKEFGVESKAVMAELEKMGEFVRSASSTIEAPVVRRLKESFAGDSAKPARQGQRSPDARPTSPAARRDQGVSGAGDGRRGERGPAQAPSAGGDGIAAAAQAPPAAAPTAGDRGASAGPGTAETKQAPRPAAPRPVPAVPGVGAPAGSPGSARPAPRPGGSGGPEGAGAQGAGAPARPGAPRPGAPRPAAPGQRGPRPGPRPGNNPFSTTAT